MLVIVDMQNRILDSADENYIPSAKALLPQLKNRLDYARKSAEVVLFTRDIPIEYKDQAEEITKLQIIRELAPLNHEFVFKKNYFTLAPETLLEIRRVVEKQKLPKEIEVVGAELSICVLANILALQSVFPAADFYVNPQLVTGNKWNEEALKILQEFNIKEK
ncbi:isochorismatase family protein [Enterococcus canintestini]|uniref:Isochorismatase-like domain-containing protein n=1 Tax=Enterococcus canintestini TaxID=317010 RepID=A0A267HRC6_9ENTE|nr:isochorismatase family protein [Enterococcus canintestini]PAB00767.1 hypothetical protein AKL21_05795 [Enterococcus canintestini]